MGQEDYLDQLLNSLNSDNNSDEISQEENESELDIESLLGESELGFESNDMAEDEDYVNEFSDEIPLENILDEMSLGGKTVKDDDMVSEEQMNFLNEELSLENSDVADDKGMANEESIDFFNEDLVKDDNIQEDTAGNQEISLDDIMGNEMSDMFEDLEINVPESLEATDEALQINSEALETEMSEADGILEKLNNLGDSEDNIEEVNADSLLNETFDLDGLISEEELNENTENLVLDDLMEDSNIDVNLDDIEETVNAEDLLGDLSFSADAENMDGALDGVDGLGLEELSDEQNAILDDLDSILEEADRVEEENRISEEKLTDRDADELLATLGNMETGDDSNAADALLGGIDLGFDANEDDLFSDEDLMKLLDEDGDTVTSSEPVAMTEEEAAKALNDISEMSSEEQKETGKKKKGLFGKLFGKKDNGEKSSNNENIAEEIAVEEKAEKPKKEKKKKEKKPKKEKQKKEKKPKAEKPVLPPEPWVGVSKGNVISIVVLVLSVVALVIISIQFVPYKMTMSNAHSYYEHEKYADAYEAMSGLEVKEKDLDFYCKVQSIMWLQSKYDEYLVYEKLDKPYESLSALIKAVEKYDLHIEDANIYGAAPIYAELYNKIETILNDEFGVTVDDARAIYVLESSQEYSKAIYDIVGYEELAVEKE